MQSSLVGLNLCAYLPLSLSLSLFQVYYMCEDEGDVTPTKCPYLTQWLDTKW